MKSKLLLLFAVALSFGSGQSLAQVSSGMPQMQRVEGPAQSEAIPLFPNMKPSAKREVWYKAGDGYIVRNVSQPTLTPVLPDPAKATGAAVIVAPGGAYMILAIDHEGWRVARRLADQGIAAFVLKYRISETPDDEGAFATFAQQRMAGVINDVAAGRPLLEEPRATEDALAAIQMVRANAAKWRIDPSRVRLMGFSAGAVTTIEAGIASAASARPNFIAPFYPSLAAKPVPAGAPPMFLAIAFDDPLFGKQKLGIVEAWRQAGSSVEFHGFEKGGHGFGLGKLGTSTNLVFDEFILWMRSRGLLTPAATQK